MQNTLIVIMTMLITMIESKAKTDKEGREGADSQFSKPSQMSPAAYPHVPLDGN